MRTRSYPFFYFIKIHKLFYTTINEKSTKFISNDLISELIPRALAFWFMDDGVYAILGLYLHTKGFNFNDVYKLAGILHYNFDLNVTVLSHEN